MDIDERLREGGRKWRSSQPAAPGDLVERALATAAPRGSAERARPSRRVRGVAGVAIAAASVVAVASATYVVTRDNRPAPVTHPPAGTSPSHEPESSTDRTVPSTSSPSPSLPSPSLSPTATPTTSLCSAKHLAFSFDSAGAAAGSAVIVLNLKNDGPACRIAGFPRLSGVTSSGKVEPLALTSTTDPSYALSTTGPGTLPPGSNGAINLQYRYTCSAPTPDYRQLRITTEDAASKDIPFPPELLRIAACKGTQAEAGVRDPNK
jgi:hypothetical protein